MSDEFRRLLKDTLQADDETADRRMMLGAMKERPEPTVCAWCPGFDPHDLANRGKSHGICSTCATHVLEAQTHASGEASADATPCTHPDVVWHGPQAGWCDSCQAWTIPDRDTTAAVDKRDSDERRPCPQCSGSGTSTRR